MNRAEITLIKQALRFASWAAGEGLCPAEDGVDVESPEDFLYTYSLETGDEEWETLADRIAERLPASSPEWQAPPS